MAFGDIFVNAQLFIYSNFSKPLLKMPISQEKLAYLAILKILNLRILIQTKLNFMFNKSINFTKYLNISN